MTEADISSDDGLIEALRSYIPEVIRQNHVPGLSVAIARRGNVIWQEGFGYADLKREIPMTAETVLPSGSMGKTYTATAVMQLVERGALGLYDPINEYIKDFAVRNPLGEREITAYDLLTHRSGLISNTGGSTFSSPPPLSEHLKRGFEENLHDVYHGTVTSKWAAKVGERFIYSNTGMATLGHLVEVANPDGLSFSDYVQQNIIDPLGMASTQYPEVQASPWARQDLLDRTSAGYAGWGPINVRTPAIFVGDYPAGTILTVPADHTRVLLAYLGSGSFGGHQLLRADSVARMLTPQVGPLPLGEYENSAMGLGWVIANIGRDDQWFGHGGAHMWGWDNDFRAYPALDLAVCVMTNRWDMVQRSPEATQRRPRDLVPAFAAGYLMRDGAPSRTAGRTHPWKVSYVIGALMIERSLGALSIAEPFTAEMVDAMVDEAHVVAPGAVQLWDEQGFRAGVADMLAIPPTLDGIREALAAGRLSVDPLELEVIHRDLEGRGSITFGMNPWQNR